MADGQHSRSVGGVPAAGRETARRAYLEVSRRTLLGAPLVPLILSGAERSRSAWSKDASPLFSPVIPGGTPSKYYFDGNPQAGTPARPAPSPSPWDPGLRRDDEPSFPATVWNRALARLREAQAVLDSAASEPDQDRYDALLDSHSDALAALLALPAPDLPAIAAKPCPERSRRIDVIVPQLAWELAGSEDCLERLRRDATRLIGPPDGP